MTNELTKIETKLNNYYCHQVLLKKLENLIEKKEKHPVECFFISLYFLLPLFRRNARNQYALCNVNREIGFMFEGFCFNEICVRELKNSWKETKG